MTQVAEHSGIELPGADQVGDSKKWVLPAGRSYIVIDATYLGWSSSEDTEHTNHDGKAYAPKGTKCRACRWFEPRIFVENKGRERYVLHITGASAVPGEIRKTRYQWCFTGEEVVQSLSNTKVEPTAIKCPVCDGTGLVTRPPHVAGDQQTWSSSEYGPYNCKTCKGDGILTNTVTTFFTIPAIRVLTQAASFDEEIYEAWKKQKQSV